MAEPSIDEFYANYKKAPTPDNLNSVVQALGPSIDYSLGAVHAANDPLVRSKAQLYAAEAVQKYDPIHGATLPTFVSSHLRQLNRTARQSRSPVRIPERMQLEAFKMHQARMQYEDENGREPDMSELADFTHTPVKRLEKIQKYQVGIPSENQLPDLDQEAPDFDSEAMEYVYHGADHTDRRILEMKTGYGGHPVMAPKDIAVKLNLSPTQLTRRAIRLTNRINRLRSAFDAI